MGISKKSSRTVLIAFVIGLVFVLAFGTASASAKPAKPEPTKQEREEQRQYATKWVTQDKQQGQTYEQWASTQTPVPTVVASDRIVAPSYQSQTIPPSTHPKVLVLVNSNIYASVSAKVTQYISDLQADNYTTELVTGTFATPVDLRNYLITKYGQGDIGTVLVGDFPVAWYRIHQSWDGGSTWEDEEFPCDLFLMDLDGTWTDANSDGKYDTHTGNVGLDMWVGRIKGSGMTLGSPTEVGLINNYFTKNHAYRTGSRTLPNTSLMYIDDDWADAGDYYADGMRLAYPTTTTLVTDKETTRAANYISNVNTGNQWVHLFAHSNPGVNAFYYANRSNMDYVYSDDVRTSDFHSFFYNLFCCSGTKFTSNNCIGNWYVMSPTYGLGAVGSAKTGSMLDLDFFYNHIRDGCSLGGSFTSWYNTDYYGQGIEGEMWPEWSYGMNILGDPMLKSINKAAPSITSISPSTVHTIDGSTEITLNGTGFCEDPTVQLVGSQTFNPTSVTFIGSNQVKATFDFSSIPIGNYNVVLTNKDYQSGTYSSLTVQEYPAPYTTSVSPVSAVRGTTVTGLIVNGQNFRGPGSNLQVWLKNGSNTINATNVTYVSGTRLTCNIVIPAGSTVGIWEVWVKHVDDGKSDTGASFSITYPAPTVSGITPNHGCNNGTVTASVTGNYFRDGFIDVRLQGSSNIVGQNIRNVTQTSFICDFNLSGFATGTYDLQVTHTDDGQSGSKTGAFTVENPVPAISSLSDTYKYSGDGSFTLEVDGSNFVSSSKVRWNDSNRTTTYFSSTKLTAIITSNDLLAVGTHTIKVYSQTPGGGISNSVNFVVSYRPPSVNTVSPDNIRREQTVTLTVNGSNFRGPVSNLKVSIGSWGGTPTSWSSGTLVCNTNIPSNAPAGLYDVTVEHLDDHQIGTLGNGFTVRLQQYTITASSGGHGTVVPITPTVEYGDNTVINVNPDDHYHVATIRDNNVLEDNTETYNINNVIANHNVVVTFAIDQNTVTAEVDGGHGSVSPLAQNVDYEGTITVHITPNDYYSIASITDNNNPVPIASTITLNNVIETHRIVARFVINQYTITAEAMSVDGTVTPLTQTVDAFSNVTINISVTTAHYHVASITDNGNSKPTSSSYTVNNVTANHDVKVTFAIDKYRVNAGVNGGHGTVSPETQNVDYGTNATINMTPANGYKINTISDNGVSKNVASTYTITSVVETHDVVVSFGEIPTPNPPEPEKEYIWYLAEGSTDWGFNTYINILNPNSEAVTAKITYMTDKGPTRRGDLPLPANSQTTINPINDIGKADFSTRVECLEGKTIAVDRTMIWKGTGATSPEASASIGVTSPATTWYLPEGSSKWGFECWLLIQNPNDSNANCHITFMTEKDGPKGVDVTIPPNTRRTYNMADFIGQEDASIEVSSDVPVIPERAMYRNNRREGEGSIGTTTPETSYYLAEGSTRWGFQTWVLVQNPNDQENQVTLTYMTPQGAVPQATFVMAPNSRRTINVNTALPDKDLSIQVNGSLPVVAERSMYWNNGTGEAMHDSIGLDKPHTKFYFADGQTSNSWETWTLVQNPNKVDVKIEIKYLLAGGGVKTLTDTIKAGSRKTYSMADTLDSRAGITVESLTSGKNIMVERAMYWNNRGAGTDTIGGYSD